jgi:hypothetical protein
VLRLIIHDRVRDAEAAAAIARDRAAMCDSGQQALRETFLTLASALDDLVDLTRQLDMAATMNHDTIKNRRRAK